MSVLLVYNSSAGSGAASRDNLMPLLRSSGIDPDAISSGDDRLPEVLATRHELVVIAGGDGTVAKVIMKLADRSAPVAILPTGGSNNIARAMNIDGRLEDVIAGLRDAGVAQLDIGLAVGGWGRSSFLEAAGAGALTNALRGLESHAKTTQEKLETGRAALAETVASAERVDYRFELDGRTTCRSLLMLEVLNIPGIGPRLPLAAGAQPGDGQFQVVTLAPGHREHFLDWLKTLGGEPPVEVTSAREICLLTGPEEVRLDDPKRTRSRRGAPVRFYKDNSPARILVPRIRSGETS